MSTEDYNELPVYYVYLACCANGTLYVGSTQDVTRRLAQHNAGQGGRYTRMHRPLTLVACWAFPSRRTARQVERAMKRLTPEQKLARASLVSPRDEVWS